MLEKLIKRLEREGKIRKQRAGIVQTEALLKEAILDLEEARRISSVAERATYLLAYNGMLKAGRALILLRGYVQDNGAQHKTVVEMTARMPLHRPTTNTYYRSSGCPILSTSHY